MVAMVLLGDLVARKAEVECLMFDRVTTAKNRGLAKDMDRAFDSNQST